MEERSATKTKVTPDTSPETIQKEIAIQGLKTTFLALNIVWLNLIGLGVSLALLDQLVPNWVTDLANKHMLLTLIGCLIIMSVWLNTVLINLIDRDRRWRGLLSGKEKIRFISISLAINLTIPAITLIIVFFTK